MPDGSVAAPAGALRLREVLSRLSLARQDVSEASGLVNQVVSQLIQAIRSRDGSFSSMERLGAGSYYEHVKVGEGMSPSRRRQRLGRRGGGLEGVRRAGDAPPVPVFGLRAASAEPRGSAGG